MPLTAIATNEYIGYEAIYIYLKEMINPMPKRLEWIKKLWHAFLRIHLVDRCLIIFMAVLLAQATYSLFNPHSNGDVMNIDIIIRTSIAAIFGYFLSANFIRDESLPPQNKPPDPFPAPERNSLSEQDGQPIVDRQIGFSVTTQETKTSMKSGTLNSTIDTPSKVVCVNCFQIVLATTMGLYCVLVLAILRNFPFFFPESIMSENMLATISQFRDIVSGCVGFLIGCPTTHQDKK